MDQPRHMLACIKLRLGPQASVVTEDTRQVRPTRQQLERSGECLRIVWRHQQSGAAIVDRLRNP
jgi:hypothetical protein